jgi:sugar phosphate isomerase/epimerase
MDFALTTRWNAGRHTRGESMITEILDLGFSRVELGYDLRIDLVPGVKAMVEQGAVQVDTVHNFCPVPVGAPKGHPELFTLAAVSRRERESAIAHTSRTIRFAAEIGARAVVVHAGNVDMKRLSDRLAQLCRKDHRFSAEYERLRLKLQVKREKKARRQLKYLYESIGQLLPVLEECQIRLALENLPTWEAMPTEIELEALLGYWHDIGHGQVRENLGFINQVRWMDRLKHALTGMHIHDVAPPVYDHLMPPEGNINFSRFKRFAVMDIFRVFEPTPRATSEAIIRAKTIMENTWRH